MRSMRQITAGLKKEVMFFSRGFRFIGVIIGFLGCALLNPLLYGLMILMGNLDFSEMAEMGMDFDMGELFAIYQGETGLSLSYFGTIDMFAGAIPLMPIIIMAMLIGTAGNEQKKRAIIVPQTAGLTPAGYVLPKFMLYPASAFVLTMLSLFLTSAVSHMIFGISFSFGVIAATGAIAGLSVMFMVCLYLFLGISLAQPGLSMIYAIAGNMIVSLIITLAFEITAFTPWNLFGMAGTIVMEGSSAVDTQSVIVTAAITLVLCVAFVLLSLFAMVAKRVDNTADEVY